MTSIARECRSPQGLKPVMKMKKRLAIAALKRGATRNKAQELSFPATA
ncbi:MAG: hypothetical protein WBC78_26460 [Candidatus Sulfotelmatobacter sp.]